MFTEGPVKSQAYGDEAQSIMMEDKSIYFDWEHVEILI